jgi:hypothetical protein
MRRMFLAGVGVAVLWFGPVVAAAQDTWTNRAMGQYGGRMIASAGPLPSSIDLAFTEGGGISGAFGFSRNGTRIAGRLDSCSVMRPFLLSCHWRNEEGEGTLEMRFSRNLDYFVGRWNEGAEPIVWRAWYGRKLPSI